MQETQGRSLGLEDPLEKGTDTRSRTVAWKMPWMRSLAGAVPEVVQSRTRLSDAHVTSV